MKYGGLGIAAFLYVGFTEWTGLSLACPFRWLTGLQCPGCGATRMIPKVEACLCALEGGAGKTHIIDGRLDHSLILEIFTPQGIGTQVVR